MSAAVEVTGYGEGEGDGTGYGFGYGGGEGAQEDRARGATMSEGPMSEAEATKLLEELRLKRFLLAKEQETIATHVAVCERHGYDEDTAEPIATWLDRALAAHERTQLAAEAVVDAERAGDAEQLASAIGHLRAQLAYVPAVPTLPATEAGTRASGDSQ